MTQEIAIKTNNLTKIFDKNKVVNNLNIEINKGEIFGFLGPNGSGKSTTIKMLCGLISPTAGDALVNGKSILTSSENIKREIGYMSQKFSLYDDLTSLQNLRFYATLYGIPKEKQEEQINKVIRLTHLDKEKNKQVSKLSGGYRQRLAFASALVHNPEIIFLDEPTAGIDPVARKEMWDLFFNLTSVGLTLFITTHYMDEAERCKKLGYIYNGNLAAYGLRDELKKKNNNLENLFVEVTREQNAE